MIKHLNKIATTLEESIAHPDIDKIPAPGSTTDGDNSFLAAPTNNVQINKTQRREHWREVDLLLTDRWMRLYLFGGRSDLLALAGVQYVMRDHQPTFDAPGFDAAQDMLIMLARGSSPLEVTRRILGQESDETLAKPNLSPTRSMLGLAQAFQKHNLVHELSQTALSRSRMRLYIRIPGENNRYQHLLKDLGFHVERSETGTTMTRPCE